MRKELSQLKVGLMTQPEDYIIFRFLKILKLINKTLESIIFSVGMVSRLV